MKKMGYIGKSFAFGAVGILGSIIAACGGGGVTDVVAQSATPPSPYVLFASQYKELTGASGELKAQSFEGGYVYGGSGGNFVWNDPGAGGYSDGTWTNAAMQARQSFGIKWQQNGTTSDGTSYAYIAVKAPANGSVDTSSSTKLVIQMGNGTWLQYDNDAKKVFRVELKGGTQNTSNYTYPNSCYYDQTLDSTAIRDSGNPAANEYGLKTYEIDLANFTCESGDITTLQADTREVGVKIVGGIDAATDSSTAGAYTYVQTGMIAFSR